MLEDILERLDDRLAFGRSLIRFWDGISESRKLADWEKENAMHINVVTHGLLIDIGLCSGAASR